MLMGDITNSGSIPALEMMVKFAGARQRVIAHNIANLDTPNFIPTDASPAAFQQALGEAVAQRRARTGGEHGTLNFQNTKQVVVAADGQLTLHPTTPSGNILFHDRNNRDLERLMQDNAENVGAFRVATDLLRSRYEILKSAIAERA
jgi:flagellar basal-body rod protein FlgB